MKRLTHQLIPWLNFLLIIALLRSFLQPIPLAWASTPPPSLVPALRVGTPPERSGVPGGAKLDAGASSLHSNAGALERGERGTPQRPAFVPTQEHWNEGKRGEILSVIREDISTSSSSPSADENLRLHQQAPGTSEIIAQSTFDEDAEGWIMILGHSGSPYESSGGNPGGHLRVTDNNQGGCCYTHLRAPSKFLGDISAAYGYALTFDAMVNRDDSSNLHEVRLVGGGLSLSFFGSTDPGTNWTSFNILLHESAGWTVDGTNPPRSATKTEMLTVLSSVTEFHINADYFTSGGTTETYRLDNVILYGRPLPPDQTLSKSECPICGNDEKQNFTGDPINSYTGNLNYETTDLSISALGQPLRFERSYNSLATPSTSSGQGLTDTVVYSQPLGVGWTHNYDLNLTFEDGPYGEEDTVILKAPHGSRMRFSEVSTGTYEAFPGVWAEMSRQGTTAPYTYVITAANQTVYTFIDPTTIDLSFPEASFLIDDVGGLTTVEKQPTIAYNPKRDEYLVTFVRDDGAITLPNPQIYAWRLDQAGNKLGNVITITTTALDPAGTPHVTFNADADEYLVVWSDNRQEETSADIYAQRLSDTGTLIGSNFVVTSQTGVQQVPRVAYDTDSQYYLVIWQDNREGDERIYGQRLTSGGSLAGGDFQVSLTDSKQEWPDLVTSQDEFLVVWQDQRAGNYDIYAQRIQGSDGARLLSNDGAIATGTNNQLHPSIGYNPHVGSYLAAWDETGEIQAQRLDNTGSLTGTAFF